MFLTDRHGACPYITEGEHALLRRLLPRPLGEGRVRAILTASPGGMRCRPYNYGGAQPRPQAP